MIQSISQEALPEKLRAIPQPPACLYIRAAGSSTFQEIMARPRIAIVGTRAVTSYGKDITSRLAKELAMNGVVIVSGLAFGVDAIAHKAALDAGGLTMAVLPSPVETIQPRSHVTLGNQIVSSGGALVSEYPAGSPVFRPNFVERNRIVTALADALLITEAAENSGTMHTARYAQEQGMDVLAVPGNITSAASIGTNNLIKTGAAPVTCAKDVLYMLQLPQTVHAAMAERQIFGANPDEQHIIDLLREGVSDGHRLLDQSGLSVELFNHHMTMLEITAKIRALGANHWALG